jgi:predicted nucleic acid-binding protein
MYLVDTNIWLERLLDQNRSDEVRQFLDRITSGQLLITDFSLHSIGVILTRLRRSETLLCFLQDVLIEGGVRLASITPEEMPRLLPGA